MGKLVTKFAKEVVQSIVRVGGFMGGLGSDDFAGEFEGEDVVFDDEFAIDDHVGDAGGVLMGLEERAAVADFIQL